MKNFSLGGNNLSVSKSYKIKNPMRDSSSKNVLDFSYLAMKNLSQLSVLKVASCQWCQMAEPASRQELVSFQFPNFSYLPMKNLSITMSNVTTVPKTTVSLDPISRMVFDNSSTEKQIQSVAQSVAFMDKLGASEVIEFIEFKRQIRAKNKAWRDAHPLEKEDSQKEV